MFTIQFVFSDYNSDVNLVQKLDWAYLKKFIKSFLKNREKSYLVLRVSFDSNLVIEF
jgi:hypothetical protein